MVLLKRTVRFTVGSDVSERRIKVLQNALPCEVGPLQEYEIEVFVVKTSKLL